VPAEPNFRVFYLGYATSLLGSAMSGIALTFAVLRNVGDAADLADALGGAGFAVIGPLAGLLGTGALLGVGVGYAALSNAVVLILPAIRSVTWGEPAAQPESVFE
jgi:hypothetical protein